MKVRNGKYNIKKVRQEGGVVVITLSELIPKDWKLVRLEEISRPAKDKRIIEFTRVA